MLSAFICLSLVWVGVSSTVKGSYEGTHHYRRSGATNNSTILPIDLDDNDTWYSYFSVGAHQNQRLNIALNQYYAFLSRGAYNPGSASQGGGSPIHVVTAGAEANYLTGVDGKLYYDHIGIPGSSLEAVSEIIVVDQTDPSAYLPPYRVDLLPLVGSSNNWLSNLCLAGLSQCRFGIAIATDQKGVLVLGKADPSFYQADLTRVKISPDYWTGYAHVIANNKTILVDTGQYSHAARVPTQFTNGRKIIGTPAGVRKVFRELNITEMRSESPIVRGYFPCDKPPSFGFGFEAVQSTSGANEESDTVFEIEPSAFIYENIGSNKCVAILEGIDTGFHITSQTIWFIGSSFFRGRYVDFDVETKSMGIGAIKNQGAIINLEAHPSPNETKPSGSRIIGVPSTLMNLVAVANIMLILASWI